MNGQGLGKSLKTGQLSAGRLILITVMLLAFSIQGYVTQTHIHGLGISKVVTDNSHHHDNYPANDDPANCPLCQEMLHSGQFVAPAGLVFFLPMLAVSVIAMAMLPIPRFSAVSHIWRGRGPPRA